MAKFVRSGESSLLPKRTVAAVITIFAVMALVWAAGTFPALGALRVPVADGSTSLR